METEQGRKARDLEQEREEDRAKVKLEEREQTPLVSVNVLPVEKKLHIRQVHPVMKLNVPNVVE